MTAWTHVNKGGGEGGVLQLKSPVTHTDLCCSPSSFNRLSLNQQCHMDINMQIDLQAKLMETALRIREMTWPFSVSSRNCILPRHGWPGACPGGADSGSQVLGGKMEWTKHVQAWQGCDHYLHDHSKGFRLHVSVFLTPEGKRKACKRRSQETALKSE